MNEECIALVWRILSGIPIDVYDDETNSVWEGGTWELVSPRTTGDYSGSRVIGSANIVSAYSLLYLKLISKRTPEAILAMYHDILKQLELQKLIRRRPDVVRQSFKVI